MPRRKSWFLIWNFKFFLNLSINQWNSFICHKLFKQSTVQSEAGPQIWELSTWPEQGLCIQLTDVLSRVSSRVTAVHRLFPRGLPRNCFSKHFFAQRPTAYLANVTFLISASGWYLYIETSSPRQPNDKARLISPSITKAKSCLLFFYHMYGYHVNELRVFIFIYVVIYFYLFIY
jgi:hypothetical protein